MLRWIGRWVFRLVILVIVLLVAAVLLKDTILKAVAEQRIRSQTGLDVHIGKLEVGLLSPTVTLEDFRLYNPPEFGGSVFLDLPEVHVEYDPEALRSRTLKLKLLRFNLGELNIVENQAGLKNVDAIHQRATTGQKQPQKTNDPLGEVGFDFGGIETLNLTLSKLKYTSYRNPQTSFERNLGVQNQILTNVKSEKDLQVFLVNLALRQGLGSLLDGSLRSMIQSNAAPVSVPVAPAKR